VAPKRRKRRKPLVFGLIVLLLLLGGGGVGAWIVIYHPFSVPAVTQPRQTFNNSQFGLSLQYPSGWHYQNDQATATVHFYDSNHTAQFNVVVSPANGDPSLYLQQQASHLGLTGQKAGPDLTFAGTSWHQLQGTVQQNGATYSETVFVAAHNQHFLTLTFLFPQLNYAQEDRLIFSQIRSTIQFLS
jgi:predicted Zn-dependent protease